MVKLFSSVSENLGFWRKLLFKMIDSFMFAVSNKNKAESSNLAD
jgi:hypothetical protein